MTFSMTLIWIIAAVVFLIVELCTVAFCSIWFTIGCVCAIPAAALGAPVWLQIVIFAAVSGLCFAVFYPRLKKHVKQIHSATNADRLIGQQCVILQAVDRLAGTGTASVNGQVWTVTTEDNSRIETGVTATILRIRGAKLVVEQTEPKTT